MTLTQLRASTRRKISFQSTASAKYLDADLDANLNEWYRTIAGWIFEASGIWEFSGDMLTTDLVDDQAEYVFPATLVGINRVEVKYANSTEYVEANRIDDKQVEGAAFGNGEIPFGSTGSPVFRLFDNSLFLYPVPTDNSTNGLRIELMEDITDLSAGGDIPIVNPLIHRALAIGAAWEYCSTLEQPRRASMLWNQLFGRPGGSPEESLKHQIQMLASQRDRSVKQRIIPRRTSFR